VPTIVASQWKTESKVTTELMVRFHKGLAGGLSPAAALREAQRAVRPRPPGIVTPSTGRLSSSSAPARNRLPAESCGVDVLTYRLFLDDMITA
jgi:hypothetical protein